MQRIGGLMALLGGAGVLAAGGLDRQTSLRSRLVLDRDAADSAGEPPRAPQTKSGLKLKVRGGRHLASASASASAEDLQERMQENEDTESGWRAGAWKWKWMAAERVTEAVGDPDKVLNRCLNCRDNATEPVIRDYNI
eukprot:g14185.t1